MPAQFSLWVSRAQSFLKSLMARARYKLKASASQPSTGYVVTISTIPDNQSITAGSAYSNDLSVYVGGADAGLATLSLTEVSGTLSAVDLSFSSPTLSGATPDVGSVSLQLVAKIGGVTIATSNTFIRGVTAAAPPDTLYPTQAAPAQTSVVSSSRIDVTFFPPMDEQTSSVAASGLGTYQPQYSASGGSWTNFGSAISFGATGEKLTRSQVTIGSPNGTITQGALSLSVTGAASSGLGYDTAADAIVTHGVEMTGDFDVLAYLSITSGDANGYGEIGIRVAQSNSTTAAMYCAQHFQTQGDSGTYRLTSGGSRGQESVLGNIGSHWRWVSRSGNTITDRRYASTGWETVATRSVTMTDPVYVQGYGCANGTTQMVGSIQHFCINKITKPTVSFTGLTASTPYRFRIVCTDQATPSALSTTGAETISTSTSSSGGAISFHPGLWRSDSATTRVGVDPDNLTETLTEPSYVVGLLINLAWGKCQQAQGVYDFSSLTSYYNQLAAAGKYMALFLRFSYTTSSSTFNTSALPAYLNDGGTFGGFQKTDYVQLAKVFKSAVADEFIAYIQALAAWGNDKPYFEGVMLEETSWAVQSPIDSQWSQANFNTQLKRIIAATRAAMPTKLVTSRANWGTSAEMIDIAQASLAAKAGTGTTDVYTHQTDMEQVMSGAVGGVDYRTVLPQTPSTEFSAFGPSTTAATLISYARNTVGAHYLFPVRYPGDGWTNSTWSQIKSAYVSQGSVLNMTKPSSYP